MTRRGSLAYYLAAWVCGCIFMAIALWLDIHGIRTPSSLEGLDGIGFLGVCFFGLFFGAVPSLLFGWLLRRMMRLFPAERAWIWIVMGAGLALLVVWLLGNLAQLARDPRYLPYSAWPIWPFLIVGPALIVEGGVWMTLPVGAATAGVLFAVHRAFAQKAES